MLRPELSALLGGERFLREIEVTAKLQHPHVLPLFDSGEADGLLLSNTQPSPGVGAPRRGASGRMPRFAWRRMDRKALIRQYKEAQRPVGVFRVHNTVNGKSLVGASTDVPSMLNRQRAQLRLGVHRNHALQADWNALGEEAFAFEVLDTLALPEQPDWDPSDELRVLEALWLERLSPYGERGYHPDPKPQA